MNLNTPHNKDDTTEAEGSLYDAEPMAEEDLWFLPGPDDEQDIPPGAAPLPRANRRSLVDVAAWLDAEAALARPLADLAARLGALDERMRRAPAGWRHRSALIEAENLSWLGTERVSVERLSLWQMMRLAGVHEDSQALLRAGWAVRRLSGGVCPSDGSPEEIAQFLERRDPGDAAGQGGESLSDLLATWCEEMERASALHPICRAAFGFHLWGVVGLLDQLPGADMDVAVLAARLAADGVPGGALFMPVSGGAAVGLRRAGSPHERLQRFLHGAESAILSALRHLDQLDAWQQRAEAALAHKSGRTPAKLVRLLGEAPLVSAPMAEAETGASRAAVQRNLNEMVEMGLAREVTGQGRYRVWVAKL